LHQKSTESGVAHAFAGLRLSFVAICLDFRYISGDGV